MTVKTPPPQTIYPATRLSHLTEVQRQHLAYRMDHHTGYGLLTICAMCRGDHGDFDIVEKLIDMGMTERQAKVHRTKVRNFKLGIYTIQP